MSNVAFDFHGKNFVVTGASSGMGKQVALELVESGASVLALARRRENLSALAEESAEGIYPAACDVREPKEMEAAVKAFVKAHGKIDGGVHAAGTGGLMTLRFYDEAKAHDIVNTSFWGAVNFMHMCARASISHTAASFVLFSSVAAVEGLKGGFAYSAAKAAVDAASHSFAKELARRKQRVNTIQPGWVDTEMTREGGEMLPDGHLQPILDRELLGAGRAQDVAGVVLFLLSDRASWMTGAQIPVDGGYLA
ncbi:MAG: SDR family oxidoreductase [Selenomonas bovis]|nr:SDR family oxidoreductase [Selenomonas bovis]